MKNIHVILFAILMILVACTKDEAVNPNIPLMGKWGGQGVEILATDTQINFSFDCASGVIEKNVVLVNNQFIERGTYTVFKGNNPINIEPPQPQNVQYQGNLASDVLTLSIKSDDGKTQIATYTISKNVVAKIVKCL
ncbi:hypothetical protein VB796_23540 [Arcicella sp. LKC2W]|uniref:hypothetical protein n=1 Tax=Arcicella sp. LKC2W TaxID=2984198 RepID=UPI002B1FFD12|nr:hypothetical protein [Arcicella sp. LKC2W]MEA5462064.1 hypothetical protein [Arcicella sp. LKC2W]